MGLFNFKSKTDRDEVLQHSISIAPNFELQPSEFYDAVEKALKDRKLPDLRISRVEHAEGGILSNKRVYLRMMRERLAFDACAAPFGVDYFFSCRTVYTPPTLRWWHVLVVLCSLQLIYNGLAALLGYELAAIALLALLLAVVQVFRNTIAMGLADLDQTLLRIPALGPVYERYFRKDTYYRKDTRLVYLEIVPKLIGELIEEFTAAKGAKLVRQYELAPIFGDLYKPKLPEKKQAPP